MFDRFVVVDWSANSTPKRGRDSIWVAVHDGAGCVLSNPSTRREAEDLVGELIEFGGSSRTLIGVDFSLGYPAGTAAALGLAGTPWRAMGTHLAAHLTDSDRNANNRFAVASDLNDQMTGSPSPFWGCPPSAVTGTLTSTKPTADAMIAPWRLVERTLMAQGHRPFSSWQLLGVGAVGSQSLVGIPVIERLRRRFDQRVHVWPLSTSLRPPQVVDGDVVIAEVWPTMLPIELDGDVVRDAEQVRAAAEWLVDVDRSCRLPGLFAPSVGPDAKSAVEREEGWILGAMPS